MKRASYREAVAWIALNDEPEAMDVESVQGLISSFLVADLFGVPSTKVAADVIACRRRERPTRAIEVFR